MKQKQNQNSEHVYLPNEIFYDIEDVPNSSHRAFVYSYIYYVTYLYRYCKYQGDQKNTQADIKQSLGYNSTNKKLDYLIKKDGLVDLMGYTATTTDYPVLWEMNSDNLLEFTTINEVKNKTILPIISEKNFKVKYPIKSFYRTDEDEKARELTGTFYDVSNTHKILHTTFTRMMADKSLGVIAFYIHSYISYKNTKHGLYQASFDNLAIELGISKMTLAKYMDALEKANLLYVKHQKFIVGVSGKANSYRAK